MDYSRHERQKEGKNSLFLEDIIEVTEGETYGGKEKQAVRIGMPYGTTDRMVIKTVKQNYILFTTNKYKILDIINK
ncbi:hypothetical protein ABE236_08680 [Priestia endophytica]|uniref:SunI/YnzG family protein n=1 Tax=Priestia endophytica TaxID=135735 RepID=UPI003D2CBC03